MFFWSKWSLLLASLMNICTCWQRSLHGHTTMHTGMFQQSFCICFSVSSNCIWAAWNFPSYEWCKGTVQAFNKCELYLRLEVDQCDRNTGGKSYVVHKKYRTIKCFPVSWDTYVAQLLTTYNSRASAFCVDSLSRFFWLDVLRTKTSEANSESQTSLLFSKKPWAASYV